STKQINTINKYLKNHLTLHTTFNPQIKTTTYFYPTNIHNKTLKKKQNNNTFTKLIKLHTKTLFI
ncbi:hypothetical protein DF186_18060, partial [Enterococcus hirae]